MAKESKSTGKKETKVKINYPDKFSASTIIQFVAEKNNITKKQAKEIIEDLYDVIQAGAMNGGRIPMGGFGKLYVRVRPATKARIGRNPLTGEEITIPAKKATKVPKFVFSKAFKGLVLNAKIKE